MLRLNWMLSKRLFKKCPPDDAGCEVWYRADCTVYRCPGVDGKRIVRFDHKDETGRVWRTELYEVDDPRVKETIDKLSTPFGYSVAPIQRETLEDLTRHAANAFDKMAKREMETQEMLEIVECKHCHEPEYLGMMIWHNGRQLCRKCTYERWQKDSEHGWGPGPTDYTFPLYSDGLDYSKHTNTN